MWFTLSCPLCVAIKNLNKMHEAGVFEEFGLLILGLGCIQF